MKYSPWLTAAVLSMTILSLSVPSAALADQSRSGISAADARASLVDAHRKLLKGIQSIDSAQREVHTEDEYTGAMLRVYRQRHWQKLAALVSLEKELLVTQMAPDAILQVDLGVRVGQAHLAALRLRSEFERFNAPTGAVGPGCYGSISGNVQGPGGPLEGLIVQAYVAEGASAGSGFTDINGDYLIDPLPIGDYYVVTSNADGLIDEVFDNVECPGGVCDPTAGSAVTVSAGTTTPNVDFTLAAGGGVAGSVTVALPFPGPALFTTVNIFDATGAVVASSSTVGGAYSTLTGLPSGTYYVVTADLLGKLDELYDNIPCPAGVSCDPTSGTGVQVTSPNITSGVNLDLVAGGNIAGNITDDDTTLPIESIFVGIHNDAGLLVTFGATDASGDYTGLAGLSTDNFFVVTGNLSGYVDELYNNMPCTGGFCDITAGTTVAVTQGSTTSGIDFALDAGGTFSGTVTKDSDGSPIAGAFLLAHSASGVLLGTAETDNAGDYTITTGLGTGSYRASTLNPYGYNDELFDDLPCVFSTCDVTVGTPVAVTIGVDTPNIDFGLAGNSIVSCDFEDCSTCGFDVLP
jgi:hypothetical protein